MVFEKLRKLIAQQLSVEEETITMDTNFEEDLGVDSLDILDLSLALEEEFGAEELPEEELKKIMTVGDLVRYLQKNLEL